MRRALLPVVLTLVLAPAAHADRSTSAPAYPGSKLAMKVKGDPRAGAVVRVKVTGTNANSDDIAYSLDVFGQPRSLFKTCPRSIAEERQRFINFAAKMIHPASELDEGTEGPFSITVPYRSGTARKVVFCAYTTYITDDAASATLRHTFRAPR